MCRLCNVPDNLYEAPNVIYYYK